MRELVIAIAGLSLGGCATLSAASGKEYQPFQGKTALDSRIKEINDKLEPAVKICGEEAAKSGHEKDDGGYLEVTADSDGAMHAHKQAWKGDATVEGCFLREIDKTRISAQPGPPVSWLLTITPPGAPPPPAPDLEKAISEEVMQAMSAAVSNEVDACEQRYLPPEFGADITVAFFIMPGGKTAAANTVASTAKDGNFENCVQDVIRAKQFPDLKQQVPVGPVSLHYHVGRLNRL